MSRDDYDERFECFDDTRCYHCGNELPSNPDEDTPAFRGFCSEQCEEDTLEAVLAITRAIRKFK
jgi:endogenous inhibitor of DNA gyrase (YacG/DUF329 family)